MLRGEHELRFKTGTPSLHACVLIDGAFQDLNFVFHGLVVDSGLLERVEQQGELLELVVEAVAVLAHHLVMALAGVILGALLGGGFVVARERGHERMLGLCADGRGAAGRVASGLVIV